MPRLVWYLLILVMLYVSLTAYTQTFIYTDEFIYRSLSNEYSNSAIETLVTSENRLGWISYIFVPIITILKIFFITLCVTTGAIFSDTNFTYRNIFLSATISESVFLFSQILFSINLFINRDLLTIENARSYFPLSILSYYGIENVVSWLHYPLLTLNLFEVAYILCISWLLSKQWKPNFIESINIVLPSYGIGLVIWMVLVVFLTLQVS